MELKMEYLCQPKHGREAEDTSQSNYLGELFWLSREEYLEHSKQEKRMKKLKN